MTAVSVVPALLAATYTSAQALFDQTVKVAYGKAITDDPGNYLILAVDDPDAEWMVAATTTRDWESVGISADVIEEGDIPCLALTWNAEADVQSAVEAAYTIAETTIAPLRTNPNLSLTAVDWTLPGSEQSCMYQIDDGGVRVRLEFSIHFVALI